MSTIRFTLSVLGLYVFMAFAQAQEQAPYSDLLVKSANLIAENYILPVPKNFLYQSALMRMQAALVDTELAKEHSLFHRDEEDATPPDPRKIQQLVKEICKLSVHISQKPDATDTDYRAWLEDIFVLNQKHGVASSRGLAEAALQGMLHVVNGRYEHCADEAKVANKIEGLGIDIYLEDDQPIISYVHPGSPAERAHLTADNIILKIDGKSTRGCPLADLVSSLCGSPGTKVTLTICPIDEEQDQRPQDIVIVRACNASWSRSVIYRMVAPDSKIGYLRFPTLNHDSICDSDGAVKELAGQGMTGLILDLRTGYGSSTFDASALADRIVEGEWTLVYDSRQGLKRETRKAAPGLAYPDVPLVVLVDKETTGPRELIAAVVKATGRGLVVGETTSGQAVGRQPFRISGHDYKVWFTSCIYRTPKGEEFQHRGIAPDILVAISDEERWRIHERLEAENEAEVPETQDKDYRDAILQKAIEYLGGVVPELGKKPPRHGAQ